MPERKSARRRPAQSAATPLYGEPWAITDQALREMVAAMFSWYSDPALRSRVSETFEPLPERPHFEVVNGAAIIPIEGVLFRRATAFSGWWNGNNYRAIAAAVEGALERAEVDQLILRVDTPGGDALGIAELSDLIFESREVKPITAVISGLGASAGYYLASSASEVVVGRDAMVGSIGTIAHFTDFSKFDAEIGIQEITIVASQSPLKNPDPATEAGRAQIQADVDANAAVFVASVARNRGVTEETVLAEFGRGDVFTGELAVGAGLADRVGTLTELIMGAGPVPASSMRRGPGMAAAKTVQVSAITEGWLRENMAELVEGIEDCAVAEARDELRGEATVAAREGVNTMLAEARTEASTAERTRILGIHALPATGHAALVAELCADPEVTPEAAALRILNAASESGTTALERLRAAEAQASQVGTPATNVGAREGVLDAKAAGAAAVALATEAGVI